MSCVQVPMLDRNAPIQRRLKGGTRRADRKPPWAAGRLAGSTWLDSALEPYFFAGLFVAAATAAFLRALRAFSRRFRRRFSSLALSLMDSPFVGGIAPSRENRVANGSKREPGAADDPLHRKAILGYHHPDSRRATRSEPAPTLGRRSLAEAAPDALPRDQPQDAHGARHRLGDRGHPRRQRRLPDPGQARGAEA